MTTVASRIFRATPQRDAAATWTAIVELLTQGRAGAARTELLSVLGTAASVSPPDARAPGLRAAALDARESRCGAASAGLTSAGTGAAGVLSMPGWAWFRGWD